MRCENLTHPERGSNASGLANQAAAVAQVAAGE
jgi:hypothetical protein